MPRTRKDRRVVARVRASGDPVWKNPAEIGPRPLKTIKRVGHPAPEGKESLLISGENLQVLVSLRERFAGKVRCVYIDPPFNARSASGHYVDEMESAVWLEMMRPRIEALKPLLSSDGLIFVHIDHRELAPLKIAMDSVFGRKNFVSIITVKVKDPAGVGQQSLLFDVCEYLLVYARDAVRVRRETGTASEELAPVSKPVKGYSKALVDPGRAELVKTIRRKQVGDIRIYKCAGYRVAKYTSATPYAEYLLNFERVFADYNPGGGMINQIKGDIPSGTLSFIEYVPHKGRDAGRLARVYFLNRRILAWLHDIASLDADGNILKRTRLTNIWDIPNAQLFSEGGVDFRQGKKPEALLEKVLGLASEPGDLVLDAFLGSGTTAAAAMKLQRRWIGIEQEPLVRTHCLPRLSRVVSGADQTGISKKLKWKGGGGFLFCGLA